MLIIFLLSFISVCTGRDPSIGYTSWGGVKMPSAPQDFAYVEGDQNRTYNILSSNNFIGLHVDQTHLILKELSDQMWPGTQRPMFNVSVLSTRKDQINKLWGSKTFRILTEIAGHTYKDKWNGLAQEQDHGAPIHAKIKHTILMVATYFYDLYWHDQKLTKNFVHGEKELQIRTIKRTKYDAAIVDSQWPTDHLICKVHVPVAVKIGYPMHVDQVTSIVNRHPSQDSYSLPWEVPLNDFNWLTSLTHNNLFLRTYDFLRQNLLYFAFW